MSKKPLTSEQVWGVPADELPPAEQKDYFDYQQQTENENERSQEKCLPRHSLN